MTRPLERVDHAKPDCAVFDVDEEGRRTGACDCGLQAAIDGLRVLEAVADFGDHTYSCGGGYGTGDDETCTCGFREARAAREAWEAQTGGATAPTQDRLRRVVALANTANAFLGAYLEAKNANGDVATLAAAQELAQAFIATQPGDLEEVP